MRWDGSIEELPIGARVTVELATGVLRTGTVTGNGAAESGFGEWTEVAMDHLDSADAVERFHRSRVTLIALKSAPRDGERDAIEAYAKALADEADRRGTSISIHRCPKGEWIVGFGENMQEVLAHESDFGNALFAATLLRAFALQTKEERSPQTGEER